MSYISKMKREIKKDIDICDELLKKDYVFSNEILHIIGKYKTFYPNFSDGFKNYATAAGGKGPNHIENVKILKSKLELLEIEIENPVNYQQGNSKQIFNLNNSNTNTNTNNISINMTYEQIRDNINENTYISDSEKDELLSKLNEIEELKLSNESKKEKWFKAKDLVKFIIDKGADIAIMFLPKIVEAINTIS